VRPPSGRQLSGPHLGETVLRILYLPVHLAQAARARGVLHLTRTPPGPDLRGDADRNGAPTGLGDLPADIGAAEVEAVAERDGILALLEANADPRRGFLDEAAVGTVVEGLAGRRATEAALDGEQRGREAGLQDGFDGLISNHAADGATPGA